MALTIWSDSLMLTRGSFWPYPINRGVLMFITWKRGEIFWLNASLFSTSPTLFMNMVFNGFQYGGMDWKRVLMFD